MSVREKLSMDMINFLNENGLNEVYGVIEGYGENKKYRCLTFCKARVLDGEIRIYGENCVMVKWETAFRDMSHRGMERFGSLQDAKYFISKNFVRG
jgi:hypothetical protein